MELLEAKKEQLLKGKYDSVFHALYGGGAAGQAARYAAAVDSFCALFGKGRSGYLFSAPGRTEVGGNHTDHQHGRVLAAGVNLDVIAVVSPNNTGVITIHSEGFDPDFVDSSDLTVHEDEKNHSQSLVRGMCAAFREKGFQYGGFDAYTISNVLKGSGLSSSAAFEVLVGEILNFLYNDNQIDPVTIAQMAQYAENVYFGKPCGLMDQTACAVGGFVAIDFEDTSRPVVEQVDFSFADCGHDLVITDTKGNHSDLTGDYAAIRNEMCAVAREFGKETLRFVDEGNFYSRLGELRKKVGDRAVLRAIHFFDDNRRAKEEADALRQNDFERFKDLICQSGQSSFMHLQNAYSIHDPASQGIPLGMAISERILAGHGAWRVHGGGFAGTMQAFVPCRMTKTYCDAMEAVFGKNSCHILSVRPVGAVCVEPDLKIEQ